MKLSKIIASSCRQNILETLSKVKQTHIIDLVRKVNSTYCQVNRNVQILEQEGIVKSHKIGRLRIIKLNNNNPKTEAILQALKILRQQQDSI
jgi:predicted transcriptional regulator